MYYAVHVVIQDSEQWHCCLSVKRMKTCSEAIAKLVRVCVCVSGGSSSIMQKTMSVSTFLHGQE